MVTIWGVRRLILVAPFLSESLSVPALPALGQVVHSTDLVNETHVEHALKNTEEAVIRGLSDLPQLLKTQFAFTLEMLSNLKLANGSGLMSCYDVAAVRAEEVALEVVPCHFPATTYRADGLCES